MTGMRPHPPAAVRITDRRLILTTPCYADVIALPRAATGLDPAVAHHVVRRGCDRPWTVGFLAERRHGLRVRWTDPT